MATNNNSSNNKSIATNTRIVQFYNPSAGEDSSTLSLGFWKDYVSFNINPILPEEERTNGKVYNYEKTASFLLSIENLYQIYTGIRFLEKSIKEKTNKIISVAVKNPSSKVILKIGNGGEYEGINDYYIALLSLNDNEEVDGEAFYIFTRPDDGLMINFDEATGNFKNKNINTQWELFKKFIDYALNNLINGSIHGSNNFNNYRFTKLESMIENIGGGNSVSTPTKSSGFSGTRRRRNSITTSLANDNSEELDRDEMFDEIENDTDFDLSFDDDVEEEEPKKKVTKRSNVKKTTKKITVDEIANDIISEDLDELDDID